MTNKEILEKAIRKAIDNGFNPDGIENISNFKPTIRNTQAWVRWFNDDGKEVIQDLEHVIFNHDFAKALWGEARNAGRYLAFPDKDDPKHGSLAEYGWRYHLQKMVIAENPLDYLGEQLDD